MLTALASTPAPELGSHHTADTVQTAAGTDHTILLIDDDVWFHRLVRALLAGTPYHLIDAKDGTEGFSRLRDTPVDILITDILMPGQSGLAIIHEVRTATPQMKIIAVSGTQGKDRYLRAAEMLGADTILKKPITRASLLDSFDRVAEL